MRKGGKLTPHQLGDRELRSLFELVNGDGSGCITIDELTSFVWSPEAVSANLWPQGIDCLAADDDEAVQDAMYDEFEATLGLPATSPGRAGRRGKCGKGGSFKRLDSALERVPSPECRYQSQPPLAYGGSLPTGAATGWGGEELAGWGEDEALTVRTERDPTNSLRVRSLLSPPRLRAGQEPIDPSYRTASRSSMMHLISPPRGNRPGYIGGDVRQPKATTSRAALSRLSSPQRHKLRERDLDWQRRQVRIVYPAPSPSLVPLNAMPWRRRAVHLHCLRVYRRLRLRKVGPRGWTAGGRRGG